MSNPESMMKMTKKGKTVMMFVRVNQYVDREETEQITSVIFGLLRQNSFTFLEVLEGARFVSDVAHLNFLSTSPDSLFNNYTFH